MTDEQTFLPPCIFNVNVDELNKYVGYHILLSVTNMTPQQQYEFLIQIYIVGQKEIKLELMIVSLLANSTMQWLIRNMTSAVMKVSEVWKLEVPYLSYYRKGIIILQEAISRLLLLEGGILNEFPYYFSSDEKNYFISIF